MRTVYYVDESEYGKGVEFLGFRGQDKIFVLGGFSIPYSNLRKLKIALQAIKARHGMPLSAPIKWNFKDEKVKRSLTGSLGNAKYHEIVQKSDQIRKEVLTEVCKAEYQIKILMCASFRMLVPKRGRNFFVECFTNYIQRIGLDMKFNGIKEAMLVIDTQAKERESEIFDVYQMAYEKGEDRDGNRHSAGSLKSYDMYPSLLCGSDLHSEELQVADMLVGVTKEFLTYVYENNNDRKRRFQEQFSIIYPCFRTYKNAVLKGGLVLSPAERFPTVAEELALIKKIVEHKDK